MERSVCRKANSFAVLVLIRVHGASGIFVGRTKRNVNSAGGFGTLARMDTGMCAIEVGRTVYVNAEF